MLAEKVNLSVSHKVGQGISGHPVALPNSINTNEELPNLGYFQYCVCTPTQTKLTLTDCLFL